jgi:hypothetical protein
MGRKNMKKQRKVSQNKEKGGSRMCVWIGVHKSVFSPTGTGMDTAVTGQTGLGPVPAG